MINNNNLSTSLTDQRRIKNTELPGMRTTENYLKSTGGSGVALSLVVAGTTFLIKGIVQQFIVKDNSSRRNNNRR